MAKRYSTRSLSFVLIAVAAALLPGCATDTPFAPDDPVFRSEPDLALAALQRAYEARSLEDYEALLHPDFRFFFDDPAKTAFDRADDLASTRRMFSGRPGKNSRGEDTPAVAGIDFDKLEVLDAWSPVADGEVDWSDAVGVLKSRVRYSFVLNLVGGRAIRASGRQVVYVVPVKTEDWDGSFYWRWKLLGQRDQ